MTAPYRIMDDGKYLCLNCNETVPTTGEFITHFLKIHLGVATQELTMEQKRVIMESHQKLQEEQEKYVNIQSVKSFAEILQEHDKVYTVAIPELKYNIQVKKPLIEDFLEVMNTPQWTFKLLFKMLKRADPTITPEAYEQLPADVKLVIWRRVNAVVPFLVEPAEEVPVENLGKV